MKRWRLTGMVMLCICSLANAQSGLAVLRGHVSDDSGALILAVQPTQDEAVQAGSVLDQSGAVVPDAMASVRGGDREVFHGKTDGEGKFSFRGADGTYSVAITARGFSPITSSPVDFDTSKPTVFIVKIVSYSGPQATPQVDSQAEVEATQAQSTSNVPTSPTPAVPGKQSPTQRTWEYGALIQGGNGLEQRTGFQFLMVGGHLGRILTSDFGTGEFKGNFEYAVEVFPLWQSYTPKFQRLNCTGATSDPACSQPFTVGGTFTGASITPIMLRYNFTHGKRFMPWIQAAGGVAWTNHKYPAVGDLNPTDPTQTGPAADTSVWNFTPQGGIGAHYFLRPKRSVDFSVNGVHISSASLGDKNPGVNVSLQVSVGYTWWK